MYPLSPLRWAAAIANTSEIFLLQSQPLSTLQRFTSLPRAGRKVETTMKEVLT